MSMGMTFIVVFLFVASVLSLLGSSVGTYLTYKDFKKSKSKTEEIDFDAKNLVLFAGLPLTYIITVSILFVMYPDLV